MSAGCPAPEDLLDLLEVVDASGKHAALRRGNLVREAPFV